MYPSKLFSVGVTRPIIVKKNKTKIKSLVTKEDIFSINPINATIIAV